MAQNCLDRLVIHPKRMQVCGKTAAEGVPSMPVGQGSIPLELVALGLVLILEFPANLAAGKRGLNDSICEILQSRITAFAGLKDWQPRMRQFSGTSPMGLERISKPGLRVYARSSEIPRVFGGLGTAILSTPQGVMSGTRARRLKVGGEVLAHVW